MPYVDKKRIVKGRDRGVSDATVFLDLILPVSNAWNFPISYHRNKLGRGEEVRI